MDKAYDDTTTNKNVSPKHKAHQAMLAAHRRDVSKVVRRFSHDSGITHYLSPHVRSKN